MYTARTRTDDVSVPSHQVIDTADRAPFTVEDRWNPNQHAISSRMMTPQPPVITDSRPQPTIVPGQMLIGRDMMHALTAPDFTRRRTNNTDLAERGPVQVNPRMMKALHPREYSYMQTGQGSGAPKNPSDSGETSINSGAEAAPGGYAPDTDLDVDVDQHGSQEIMIIGAIALAAILILRPSISI